VIEELIGKKPSEEDAIKFVESLKKAKKK